MNDVLERAQLIKDFVRLSGSQWIAESIRVAAELGVADALGDGARPASEVALEVGADAVAVERLMRALVTLGLLAQPEGGGFALEPMGELLRSDVSGSLRNTVLMGGDRRRRAWAELVNCVRTGDSAAKLLLGVDDPFDGAEDRPEEQAVFNRSMMEGTRQIAGAVVLAYDFSGIRTAVDVGGGYGALLPPILRAHSDMTATVFDLPFCREGALKVFEKTGLADRCEFVAGNFFTDPLPAGADAYLVKSVIHDWDDDRSLAILRRCREAMSESSRLLVVEVVVPDRLGTSAEDQMVVAADLNMLVSTGGRERTESEYRELLAAASLNVSRIVPTLAGMSVIEAVPIA